MDSSVHKLYGKQIMQTQNDYWLPKPAIEKVADMLDMPHIRALEIATFYSMFNLEPVGRHFVQLCGTTPCMLRGANDLMKVCKEKIGPKDHLSADGRFTWQEVECLGACCNAPMAQINDYYYEDLTPAELSRIIDDFANNFADLTRFARNAAALRIAHRLFMLNIKAHNLDDKTFLSPFRNAAYSTGPRIKVEERNIAFRRTIKFTNPLDAETLREFMPDIGTQAVAANETNAMTPIKRRGWCVQEITADFANIEKQGAFMLDDIGPEFPHR